MPARKIGQTTAQASESLRAKRIAEHNEASAGRRTRSAHARDDQKVAHEADEDATVGYAAMPKASEDLEDMLSRLQHMASIKKQATEDYEELRDQIAPLLTEPVAFVNSDGDKWYARPQTSESMVFDVDLLERSIKPTIFRQVVKVSVDREALKRSIARGDISRSVLAKIAKVKANKTSIRFYDTASDEADSAELV